MFTDGVDGFPSSFSSSEKGVGNGGGMVGGEEVFFALLFFLSARPSSDKHTNTYDEAICARVRRRRAARVCV